MKPVNGNHLIMGTLLNASNAKIDTKVGKGLTAVMKAIEKNCVGQVDILLFWWRCQYPQ